MKRIDEVRLMLKSLIGSPDTSYLERRTQSEQFAATFVKPAGIKFEAGELGGIAVEWLIPDQAHPSRIFFHLHGGGYVLGNPASSRNFTSEFARLARCRVVSIDYRLAPEHQFPAAIEDSVCAYRALLAEGHKASNIAIGGESAGGGLAVATLVAARDRRLSMPAALIALSPWTDMRCESESFRTKADVDPLLTRRSLKEMADAYLGGADPLDGRASPAMAKLVGLPPMLVHVGSEEVLLDDSWALVKVAKAANVQARLEVWPEMIHVWHMFHPMLPEGAQAIEALAGFVLEKWKKAEMREQSVQQN